MGESVYYVKYHRGENLSGSVVDWYLASEKVMESRGLHGVGQNRFQHEASQDLVLLADESSSRVRGSSHWANYCFFSVNRLVRLVR